MTHPAFSYFTCRPTRRGRGRGTARQRQRSAGSASAGVNNSTSAGRRLSAPARRGPAPLPRPLRCPSEPHSLCRLVLAPASHGHRLRRRRRSDSSFSPGYERPRRRWPAGALRRAEPVPARLVRVRGGAVSAARSSRLPRGGSHRGVRRARRARPAHARRGGCLRVRPRYAPPRPVRAGDPAQHSAPSKRASRFKALAAVSPLARRVPPRTSPHSTP